MGTQAGRYDCRGAAARYVELRQQVPLGPVHPDLASGVADIQHQMFDVMATAREVDHLGCLTARQCLVVVEAA